jgi:hypothetical protein
MAFWDRVKLMLATQPILADQGMLETRPSTRSSIIRG